MTQQELRSRIVNTLSDAILECCDRGEDLNGMILLMHQSILDQFDPPLTEIMGIEVFSAGYIIPYDLIPAFKSPNSRQVNLIKSLTEEYDDRRPILIGEEE